MINIYTRFKQNRFFINMFFITVISILAVSILITWTVINMSERFFIEKFSIMNSKVMTMIIGNFESFDNSIVNASNNLRQSSIIKSILTEKPADDKEKMSAYYKWGEKVGYINSILSPSQIGITVMSANGNVYTDGSFNWENTKETLKNSDFTRKSLENPGRLLYQYVNYNNKPYGRENYFIASRGLADPISGKIYGSMYFSIPEKQFKSLYIGSAGLGNTIFLVDENGKIVSCSEDRLIGKQNRKLLSYAREMEKHPQKYIIKKFMGKEQIMLAEYIPYFNMYLFNMINKQEAIGSLINIKEITLLVMVIVAAALIFVFLASRRLTKSLTKLVKQIEHVSKNDFQYVAVAGTYETRQIGYAFNSMLNELHEYVDRLVMAQKKQRNAELEALQQQINPHFLYNTFALIKFMVLQGEKEEAEATINALISLLQNTIGNVDETITVEQEIYNLKNYVLINQKRYGERIKVNYLADPACLPFPIPKLILQPMVENAFFHGFNRKTQGSIHILVWQEGGSLICEVVDNGDGMVLNEEGKLPPKKKKHQLFSGIGLRNVHERIQLIYGEPYGVTVSSDPGDGTKVRITLPVHLPKKS